MTDFASERARIDRQKMLAAQLQQMGSQPISAIQQTGGRMVGRTSPMEYVAQLAQQLSGGWLAGKASEADASYASRKSAALADLLGRRPDANDAGATGQWVGQLTALDRDLGAAYAKELMKPEEFGTSPQFANRADGSPEAFVLGNRGTRKVLDGVLPREKMEVLETTGTVINPYEVKPGSQLPTDPNKPFRIGADGQMVPNEAFQSYEIGKAAAGATRVNTNVIPNTVGGEIGKAAIGDLSTRRAQAQTAASGIGAANRVMQLIDSGQIIAGSGAGAVTTLARYLPVGGKDFREKLANTQALMADLAKSALALKDQMPGPLSNADIKYLERAASSDINLEPAAIRRVAELNAQANSRFLSTFNRDVEATTGFLGQQGMGSLPFDYRVQTPEIYTRPPAAAAPGKPTLDDVAAEIARRRGRK